MEHAPVVPDGDIVLVPPLESRLQLVVAVDEVQVPLEQPVALLVRQPVDVLHVPAHGENALPARHGVGPHQRVDGAQVRAHVFGRAARLRVQAEAVGVGDFVEALLRKGDGQGLEELLVGGRDLVVDFVAGCPEGVCGFLVFLVLGFFFFFFFFFAFSCPGL